MKKDNDLFNPAFKGLHSKIKSSQEAIEKSESDESKTEKPEQDENPSFLEAMSNVTPLPGNKTRVTRYHGTNTRPAHPTPGGDQEAMAHLYDLIKGTEELDITFSDEYMKGSVKGFSRKLMKRLKNGEFPVQDYIDLHGLSKADAEIKVRDFLVQSQRLGLRCVLIVHGRGLNSPDSFPVLKERLPTWLNRGPIKKIVLAFCTAKPYDGGTGAIYVLLRKR